MLGQKLVFTVLLTIIIAFSVTAIFGIALSTFLEENGQALNCLFPGHQQTACPPPEHINEWQQVFTIVFNFQNNLLLILFLVLFFIVSAIHTVGVKSYLSDKIFSEPSSSFGKAFSRYILQPNL